MSLKKYLKLTAKKYREQEGRFIVEGVRLCREALVSDWQTEVALMTEDFANSPDAAEFQEYFRIKNIAAKILSRQDFRRLSDTETPQGILLVMHTPPVEKERIHIPRASFILLLDAIRDPGNLGTLIRCADWFGVQGIFLSGDCADPYNPKVLRSTMGSVFRLPVVKPENFKEVVENLKKNRFFMVATSLGAEAKMMHKSHFRKPVALILGNETRGVSPDLLSASDVTVRIRKYGQAESLNVAVAGAVLMNHIAAEIYQNT